MADLATNSKRLLMTFKTDEDRKVSLTVENPKDNLTEVQIKNAMDTIIAKDVFRPNMEQLLEAVEAKIVVTDTQSYDLV